MNRLFIILYFIFSLIVSQNFIYDSDDWYIVKDPGSIYSITEGPFKVYFGSDNGIFSYDFLDDIVEYDFQINRGLTNEQIFSIHYDHYSDQIWISTDNGIFYKNLLFNTFNQASLNNIRDIHFSYNIRKLGSVDRFIIGQHGSEYIFIDSFSGSEVYPPADFNINDVVWSSSYYDIDEIDLSTYYADDWLIGFRMITDTYGNQESVNVLFEDSHFNLWFGTENSHLIKGYKYTNKVEVYNIGPFSESITSVANNNQGDWFLSSGRFKRYGNSEQFRYNKRANPFLSIWNEYNNTWDYLNEDDFSELNNPDVNCIFNIDDRFLGVGLMNGLLIISLDDYQEYKFIEDNDGLSDDAVFEIEYYDDKVFAMTTKGISIYSLQSNLIIEENILNEFKLEDSEMLDMILFEDSLYLSTKAGLFEYNIGNKELKKISDNIFYNIRYHNKNIYGLNENIWIIDSLSYDESIFYYGSARNFDLTDNHIWLNLQDSLKLIDLDSKEEWIYDHNDGFENIEIFEIIDDGDWVCFLTDDGLIFYNWSNYHY